MIVDVEFDLLQKVDPIIARRRDEVAEGDFDGLVRSF
jgi:hypothetical protein